MIHTIEIRESLRRGLRSGRLHYGEGPFWVYVLENSQGRFYVGHTDDLGRRLGEHNDPDRAKSKYTRKHGPWRLVWWEEHCGRSSAVRRERFIKSRKSAAWIRQYLLGRASPDVHRD